MPQLEKLPVPKYNPLHPYHWEYDNLPLKLLEDRDEIINGEVENHAKILRDAVGTAGTLATRLNKSLNTDGTLKTSAVDQSLHNIAEHSDGSKTVTQSLLDYYVNTLGYATVVNPVPFVRMLQAERDKLRRIADEATNLTVEVETPSNIVLFEEGPIRLMPSDGIQWSIVSPNKIKANLTISTAFAHRHHYDLEPITTDFKNFKVTSVQTPYIEGSLRVYINGVKLNATESIYVPGNLVTDAWTLNKYTPSHTTGTFVLDTAITADDIIRIDFDVALV